MGGDHGPTVVVAGAAISHERYPELRFVFFGDRAKIAPVLDKHPALRDASEIVHTDVAVAMDAKPSQALRQGRRTSSMWLALEAVRDGRCDIAVSAGNTGALMAMSKFCLKMMKGIERPAIAAIWPTLRGESIVLDVGATIGADSAQLVDFAVMGGAMAGLERPTVGLLNVGVEEVKGLEYVRAAGKVLREGDFPIEYHGFVEGDDIGRGTVDVVVTEGFSGNIALKTAEGTARQVGNYLRSAVKRSIFSQIGFLLAAGAIRTLSEKMNPSRSNGGVFLGLNGIVIKSHGGADAEGVASAIAVGRDMAINELMAKIASGIEAAHGVGLEMQGRERAPVAS